MSPITRPLIREADVVRTRNPNYLAFVYHHIGWGDGKGKLLFTCDAGGFGMIDIIGKKVEAFGFIEGRPVAIAQFGDGVFALAVPEKNRIVLADCVAHPFKSENQPKWEFPMSGVTGLDWDQPRKCLWAIGSKSLVKCEYGLLTDKALRKAAEYDYLMARVGENPRDLRLSNDGRLYFITDSGVVRFSPEDEQFVLERRESSLQAYGKSIRGDMTFQREAGCLQFGTNRVAWTTGRPTAAALRPVGVRDYED